MKNFEKEKKNQKKTPHKDKKINLSNTIDDIIKTEPHSTNEEEGIIPNPRKIVSDEEMDDELAFVKGTEADVTKEDLDALGPKELNIDMRDDEQLKHRIFPVDFSANNLDVPGTELDDRDEEIGSEDEENNPYSVGDEPD